MLLGLGEWLNQGGLHRPIPTPIGYWVGLVIMVLGAGVGIYGWIHGNKLIKEGNENLLGEIKSVLIEIDTCERNAAIKKSKQTHSGDIAKRITRDAFEVFGSSMPFIASALQKESREIDIDYFITLFSKLADILDTENYGLKSELSGTQLYEKLNAVLTKKRVNLQVRKKQRILIEKNIDRIFTLTYGVNSFIIHKEIIKGVPESKNLPRKMLMTIERVDTAMRELLPKLLNDLNNEWKWKVNINEPNSL
jgi:hypothetical protein